MSRLVARLAGAGQAVRGLGLRGVAEKRARRRRDNDDYARWLREREPPPRPPQPDETGMISNGPVISVLMPTHQTDRQWLSRAIDSVLRQSYPRWELCIADDDSGPPVRAQLQAAAAAEPRIRLVLRESRGHISAASNSALALAQGEFVALLDHDDELAPDALLEVVRALARRPDADVVYSDEDKIDSAGSRSDAYFKPDFGPDLLLAQNVVSHLGVYRTSLVRQSGGFREGLEGAQDHDLVLRVLERSSPERFVHVPRVLYHWRESAESASGGLWRKSYAHEAGCRAIAEHLARTGRPARVERALYSAYRVRYSLPEPPPPATVLAREPLRHALRGADREIAPTVVRVASAALAASLNDAVQRSGATVVVLLGRGCEPQPGWLEELVSQALRPEIAVVGGKLISPSRRVRHAGHLLALDRDTAVLDAHAGEHDAAPGHFGGANLAHNVLSVSSELMAFRREAWDALRGFDAGAFPDALYGVDFCLRAIERGWRILFTPWAKAVRREPLPLPPPEEVERLRSRWRARLPRDPFWHPAMDRNRADFRLAL